MRFSLTTLLLVAFWIAAVMLVWVRREPWVADFAPDPAVVQKYRLRSGPYISPDGTRELDGDPGVTVVFERRSPGSYAQNFLCGFDMPKSLVILGFADDNTIVYQEGRHAEGNTFVFQRRRFPEWWWGHFYRPEVWLALALTGVLIWRGVFRKRAATA